MEESIVGSNPNRVLGIDYGKRYVGVAVSDPLFITAQGLEVIERKRADKLRQTLARLSDICREYEVSSIVIGFPKNLDGQLNERCEYTLEFADLLFKRVGLPVYLWDERLTTQSSERTLELLGKKDIKSVVDEMSAMLILQTFMDARSHGNLPGPYRE